MTTAPSAPSVGDSRKPLADGIGLVHITEALVQLEQLCIEIANMVDRGMISEPTIAALEERGLESVLGVRERTDRRVQEVTWDIGLRTLILRTHVAGVTGPLFQAARVALPPNVREPAA